MKVVTKSEILNPGDEKWEEVDRAVEIASELAGEQAVLIEESDIKENGGECDLARFRSGLRKKMTKRFGRGTFKIKTRKKGIVLTRNEENDSQGK